MTQITMPELSRVDPKWLRNVLGCFATGVAVVTVASELGPVGVTANSFTSVSLAPPLVLFCVANSSRSLGPIKRAKAFAVNILGKGQERVSRTFHLIVLGEVVSGGVLKDGAEPLLFFRGAYR